MADTQMSSTNALTVKRWSDEARMNLGQNTIFGLLDDKGVISTDRSLYKQKGDAVTINYTNKLVGIPIDGDTEFSMGKEEGLNNGSQICNLGHTRVVTVVPTDRTLQQQRTEVIFSDRARDLITARLAELLDVSILQQLAGANPTSFSAIGTLWSGSARNFVTGSNAVLAPSAGRIVRQNNRANDESLVAGDEFSLDMLDTAITAIETSTQPIQPIRVNGEAYHILLLSPTAGSALRQSRYASTRIDWSAYQYAKIGGGQKGEFENTLRAPLAYPSTGYRYLGRYNSVLIYQCINVPKGVNSSSGVVVSNVARNLLLGKDALMLASTRAASMNDSSSLGGFIQFPRFDLIDNGMRARPEGDTMYGAVKIQPSNALDVGVCVLSSIG